MRTILICAGATLLLSGCSGDNPDRRQAAGEVQVPEPSGPPVPEQGPPDAAAAGAQAAAGEVIANPYQQDVRPGVTGEGPVPGDFAELLEGAGDVRALYGSQQAGPYPAPPAALKEQLVKACL